MATGEFLFANQQQLPHDKMMCAEENDMKMSSFSYLGEVVRPQLVEQPFWGTNSAAFLILTVFKPRR